jgi:hypothetical protein
MPWNFGVVVKERRSMPPRAEGGRFSSRIAGVMASMLDALCQKCRKVVEVTTSEVFDGGRAQSR